MRLFQPLGLLALVAVPLILLMYLLKRRYQERNVPSLYLWERVLAETKSQEPWQKLRRNRLLFLQLAVAALLAFALAQPHMAGSVQAQTHILALDCSLSMQAQDVEESRFAAAKKDMIQLVEGASPQSVFSLVLLSDVPTVAVSHTTEKQQILRVLQEIRPKSGSVDWEEAKSLLYAEQKKGEGDISLYTDGYGFLQNMDVQEHIYCGEGENTALMLLSCKEQEEGLLVLSRVHHYGKEIVEKEATLYADGMAYDTRKVTLAGNEEVDVVFRDVPSETEILEMRLTPSDVLPADDAMFTGNGKGEKKKVLLVSRGNIFLEKAFSLMKQVECYRAEPENQEAFFGYDLYIFDGAMPAVLPTDGHCMLFQPTAAMGISAGEETEVTADVLGIETADFGEVSDISFALQKGTSLRADWGRTFLTAAGMPLAIYGEKGEQKVVAFGFDLHDSDFPLQTEFPILLHRLLEWYFPERTGGISQVQAGAMMDFPLHPASEKAIVKIPSGKEIPLAPPFPVKTFTETGEVGLYTLLEERQGNTTETFFGVNPRTEGESDLSLQGEQTEERPRENRTIQGNRNLTPLVLLLLLVILWIEWQVNCREH